MRQLADIELFLRQPACFQARSRDGSICRAGEHGIGEAVRYTGKAALPPELACFSAYHTFLEGYSFQRRRRQNFLSLEYVVSGEILLRCGGRAYAAEAGDLFLLRPGAENDWLHPEGSSCEKYGILMRGKWLNLLLERFRLDGVDFVPGAESGAVQSLFARVCRDLREEAAELLGGDAFAVLQMVRRFLDAAPPLPELDRAILDYFDCHFAEPFHPGEVAARFHMSEPTFRRRVVALTGRTPFQQAVRLRMLRAESLLAAGTLRIKEVAVECGYNSAYHFTNEFRRIYGVSPSQYRMDHIGLNHSGEKTEEV